MSLSIMEYPIADLCDHSILTVHSAYIQARQTRPNSGGVVEGHPRFDKDNFFFSIIFYFLRVKNRTF